MTIILKITKKKHREIHSADAGEEHRLMTPAMKSQKQQVELGVMPKRLTPSAGN